MNPAELFPAEVVAMDSPRLAWLKRHDVLTWHDDGKRDGFQVCPPQWFAGFTHWWPEKTGIDFFALETAHNGDSRIGEGDSEQEALCQLLTCGEARAKGIKLWNEEA
jgi:hypothetical protein